ncbi:hypothetical protein JTE90_028530 [Oedothorax gibbosus]|uniref:Uncharacterized protein n=1 Tax=Oedothorax gibbosus TaxID=931172 RepID=A0AAV6VW47_9ARAC|nr:hypothetical protein JTE90_028530 [Oedothorax gibbosus]
MEDRTVEPVGELTANYQWTIANRLAATCPAASRFYLSNLERSLTVNPKLLKKDIKRSFSYCNHCGNLWQPGNHHVRVCPPSSKNNHIKKLLKWEAENPWRLNNRQKKKLRKFNESTSKIVYTCNVCKKTSKFSGLTKQPRSVKVSFTTPVLKIRSKKDLNAGLFIKTSNEKKSEEVKMQPVVQEQPTLKPPMAIKQNTNIKFLNKPSRTQNLSMNSTTKFSKKRKSDLLTQILKQEQELPKKKSSLSSFLMSL